MPENESSPADELWHWFLTGEGTLSTRFDRELKFEQRIWRLLPGIPRCIICGVPLGGAGGVVTRGLGRRPASFSPRICNSCESNIRNRSGGAEVGLTMLFADIRDSTRLSESMTTSAFRTLVDRFYQVGSDAVIRNNGMVNRLMGDQIIGLFVPRFAGADHSKVAIQAARDLLTDTGHHDPQGPWVPVGVGIHRGEAFVGAVGSRDSINEIAVLGKNANLAARLSSRAMPGEVIISQDTAVSAGLPGSAIERRLDLKGFDLPLLVNVVKIVPGE